MEQENRHLHERLAALETEKKTIIENVNNNVTHLSFPLLRKLKRKGSPIDQRHIELLKKNLQNLTGGFATQLACSHPQLSGREKEICHMIKEGFGTKQIADLLHTSVRTIDNHRNHIRKKLGISGSKVDLIKHLQSLGIF